MKTWEKKKRDFGTFHAEQMAKDLHTLRPIPFGLWQCKHIELGRAKKQRK